MAESRKLELTLESKVDSVDAVELIVQALAQRVGHEEDAIDHLGMAVRESMANAVTHGNGYSRNKSVHVAVELEDDNLTVRIRDEGEGFDPEEIPDPTAQENLLKASGRGLLLMRALVDEFDVRRAAPCGMEVTLVKNAPASESSKEETT